MKIRHSYKLALSIFTTVIFFSFCADALAGSNSEKDSRSSEESGNNGTDGKGKKSKGDEDRQNSKGRRLSPAAVDRYIDTIFGSLFMVADPEGQIPPMLINIPETESLTVMAKSEEKGGEPSIDKEPQGEPEVEPGKQPGETKRIRKPGATIGTDLDRERLIRWGRLVASTEVATEEPQANPEPEIPPGMSPWGKEALRRLRKYGPGHTPSQGWQPGSDPDDDHQYQTTIIPPGDEFDPIPFPHPPIEAPIIFVLEYPEISIDDYFPLIGLDKTVLIEPTKDLPELEIEYIPFYTDSPATIGGPEDARNAALLAGIVTFLVTALKTIPQLVEATANAVPIFMVMPDEEGMLMIQGKGPSPKA